MASSASCWMRSTDSPAKVDAAAQISKAALCMALVTRSGICSNGAECAACSSLHSLTISPTVEK
ncbi:hypothetical protein BMETH_2426_0 [methanotrophic bacterial endosymbiont of Bathymodiolus sp.]|nr:hypothetical protein BMETH_2426_0 [methanotrophic bacterial endosymbiont of Bathymodiolus sp.]